MSQFTRVHGDYQPVPVYDAGSYTVGNANDFTAGVTVQPQGPKLAYFTVTGTGALTTAQLDAIVKATQQLSIVYKYQYNTGTNHSLAVGVYPVSAWTTTSLNTAVTAALTALGAANTTTTTAGATFAG